MDEIVVIAIILGVSIGCVIVACLEIYSYSYERGKIAGRVDLVGDLSELLCATTDDQIYLDSFDTNAHKLTLVVMSGYDKDQFAKMDNTVTLLLRICNGIFIPGSEKDVSEHSDRVVITYRVGTVLTHG